MNKFSHIGEELKEHLPFSIFSVVIGMVIMGFMNFIADMLGAGDISGPSKELFHIFHPVHILFSAAATTAMFWRHEKKVLKALVIGFVGSVGICGLSDIAIPYIAGLLMGVNMQLHVCIIEHPFFIMPFAVVGLIAGFLLPHYNKTGTIFSHTGHVLISSMASILYLIGYGMNDWIHSAGLVLIYMIIAVVLPCCTSDIILPLYFIKGHKHTKSCGCS